MWHRLGDVASAVFSQRSNMSNGDRTSDTWCSAFFSSLAMSFIHFGFFFSSIFVIIIHKSYQSDDEAMMRPPLTRHRDIAHDRPTASGNLYDLDFVFICTFRVRPFAFIFLPHNFYSLLLLSIFSRCDNDGRPRASQLPPLTPSLSASSLSFSRARARIPLCGRRAKWVGGRRWHACRYELSWFCCCLRIGAERNENIDGKLLFVDKMPHHIPILRPSLSSSIFAQ